MTSPRDQLVGKGVIRTTLSSVHRLRKCAPRDWKSRCGLTEFSCDRCRGRKTKCAGTYPQPCAACVDARQACVYSDTEKRVTVPERYAEGRSPRVRRRRLIGSATYTSCRPTLGRRTHRPGPTPSRQRRMRPRMWTLWPLPELTTGFPAAKDSTVWRETAARCDEWC